MSASTSPTWLDLVLGRGSFVEPVATTSLVMQRDGQWLTQYVDTELGGAAATVTLWSNSQIGDMAEVGDLGGAAATLPITVVDPNGYPIENPATPGIPTGPTANQYTLQANYGSAIWRLVQSVEPGTVTYWKVVASNGIVAGGGGGGGVIVTRSSSGSVAASTQPQLILISAGGGTFSLPSSGLVLGMQVGFKDDFCTSAADGIATTPVTLNGSTKNVQNRHTMKSTGTTYVFGGPSGDGGGSLVWFTYDGTGWVVTG